MKQPTYNITRNKQSDSANILLTISKYLTKRIP
ncbi:hypothetical protein SAMN06265171_101497 [Chryseobacterium rhizoplanae]|uniref:Uncharacterized protein n=1 Tax=Chryseobacterium rhizoplanae TaxID=1609531 RepID=A0A521AX30_9FLAO|nr:hypothetical protein SAMN06265171_101497 [Chryseobacterium rhizoplanae]